MKNLNIWWQPFKSLGRKSFIKNVITSLLVLFYLILIPVVMINKVNIDRTLISSTVFISIMLIIIGHIIGEKIWRKGESIK